MPQSPKISIAIPAYNRPDYLRMALHSALAQRDVDFEVVVSDDCSKEDLSKIVESFNDDRLRYYRASQNLGAVRNHQNAVDLSRGEYVIILNSDDLLLPQCLAKASAALDANPKAAAVYVSQTYLSGNQVAGWHKLPRTQFVGPEDLKANKWLEKVHNTTPSACFFRKKVFEDIGGFREQLRLAYDWELYMRFLRDGGGVIFLPEILCIYRQHEEQMVCVRSLDGLRDVLTMWSWPEYSHWTKHEIADIAWTEARSKSSNGRAYSKVWQEIRERGVVEKLIPQLPRVLCRRLKGRIWKSTSDLPIDLVDPRDAEKQVEEARSFFAYLQQCSR
jgi:glycosyltransferase involved in cell wall biosynthesis